MILTVSHVTRYGYDRAVRGVVQSHRLMPSRFDGQNVLDWTVSVTGGTRGAGFRDGAGDWVEGWTVAGPVNEIEVAVAGRVETSDLAGILRGHREIIAPEVYLRGTPATLADGGLTSLAMGQTVTDPLELAHALSRAVSDAIAYRPGVTHSHTTAAEALAQAQGVCQDHAQALVAMARVRGMPARYVSGYLSASADGAPHEAAHAWAEIHVPGFGWVGFDASNRCCPDARYIRLGSGLDAAQAAPIRGTARGGAVENLGVTVAIGESAQ